jgi:hypothetical protein
MVILDELWYIWLILDEFGRLYDIYVNLVEFGRLYDLDCIATGTGKQKKNGQAPMPRVMPSA